VHTLEFAQRRLRARTKIIWPSRFTDSPQKRPFGVQPARSIDVRAMPPERVVYAPSARIDVSIDRSRVL
jgi:hypothetical protein